MSGGNGGYSIGILTNSTEKNKILYLVCGQLGQTVASSTSSFTNAYNGGGKGDRNTALGVNGCSGGGGGATHIALDSGILKSFESKKQKLLLVAGGGGGGYSRGIFAYRDGGNGGGTSGADGSGNRSGSGGTQSSAGTNAGFGYGADCDSTYRGGAGGGGLYGGGAGYSNDAGGAGGSGYVNTTLLTGASTSQQSTSTNPDSTGNGYIKITLTEVDYTFDYKVEYNLSPDSLIYEAHHPSDSMDIKYNGSKLFDMNIDSSSKKLKCSDTLSRDEITIGEHKLLCKDDYFKGDITISIK